MGEGRGGSLLLLLLLGLLGTHPWLMGHTLVLALPEKKDEADALRREYPLEEFLWTGSGDGPGEEGAVSWLTTTVFRTTTRLLAPPASASLQPRPSPSCPESLCTSTPLASAKPDWSSIESLGPSFTTHLEPSEGSLLPSLPLTPTQGVPGATPTLILHSVLHSAQPFWPPKEDEHVQGGGWEPGVPEPRYWIVTVVEEGGTRRTPSSPLLEMGLARLYATAFKRQQERHLGIVNASSTAQGAAGAKTFRLSGVTSRRRRLAAPANSAVVVRVHNVSDEGSPAAPRRVQLVYSVHVAGRPVLARAAVHDMRLVSDAEVAHELGGLAILTKAEPYLKDQEADSPGSFTTSPWVLAAGAISAVALLGLVLCLLIAATTRHKRARRIGGHQQQQLPRSRGTTNLSFEPDETAPSRPSPSASVSAGSGTKILPSDDGEWGMTSEDEEIRPPSADTAAAAVAAAVAAARPRTREGASSPSSYLSMPSVRRFPRGASIPEPLSQVLQTREGRGGCLSVRNLDLYPDETAFEPVPGVPALTPPPAPPRSAPPGFYGAARHGSLDGEDPGVVGPCVYQMARGAGMARRRLQELLDDTFSLFGGGSEEEERDPTPPPRPPSPRVIDSRVHSAAQARVSEPESPPPRPKTSEPRRAAMQQPRRGRPPLPHEGARVSSASGPRGAWETPCETSSLASVRPLSAGPFHRPRLSVEPPLTPSPRLMAERILVDSQLEPGDPAVPLISAIKSELQRMQTCGACTSPPGENKPRDT